MNRPPSAEEYAIIAEIARTTYRITAQRLGKSRGWLNALVQSHKALYESLRHDKAALRDASNQIPPDTKARIENSEGVITREAIPNDNLALEKKMTVNGGVDVSC